MPKRPIAGEHGRQSGVGISHGEDQRGNTGKRDLLGDKEKDGKGKRTGRRERKYPEREVKAGTGSPAAGPEAGRSQRPGSGRILGK